MERTPFTIGRKNWEKISAVEGIVPKPVLKLWIDDIRDAPDDSWTEVRKVEAAINAIAHFDFDIINLDHDIENRPSDETFKPVAHFIGQRYVALNNPDTVLETNSWKPKITVHSDNPVGAKEIQMILKDYGITDVPWEPFTSEREFKSKYGLT